MKRITALFLFAALATASHAQVIRARPSRGLDARVTSGVFEIRVYVDGEADLLIREGEIGSEVFSGRPIRDAGSEYSQPLPRGEFTRFDVQRVDGRGRVELLEEPQRRNGFTARIRVEDRPGGEDRYHIRIQWEAARQGLAAARNDPRDRRFGNYRPRRGHYSKPGQRLYSGDNNPSAYDNRLEGRLQFFGRVDGEVILYIRGDSITTEILGGRPVQVERFRFSQPIPNRDLRGFNLNQRDGRGPVDLLEEPSRENGWTAVIRIDDDKSGDDRYSFELIWRR